MEFRVLGSFEVTDGAQYVELRRAKPLVVLAMLVLHPNQVVSLVRGALTVGLPLGLLGLVTVAVHRETGNHPTDGTSPADPPRTDPARSWPVNPRDNRPIRRFG